VHALPILLSVFERPTNVRRELPADVPATIAASGTMEVLSRVGYVVHGGIYLVIGTLAARLAWGARGELADPPSVIDILDKLPAGDFLVSMGGCWSGGVRIVAFCSSDRRS
jgi:hypothetical protein